MKNSSFIEFFIFFGFVAFIAAMMNMEADLGIDSIKRVEILGAVQDKLNIIVDDTDALSQTETVQDIIEFIRDNKG